MSYPIDITPQSPNHSSRDGQPIRLLILHATAGGYASALRTLCDPRPDAPDRRVSAHYLIRKDGYINQLVPLELAAWHAGISAWHGLDSSAIQKQSIGIEIENANDGHDPYPSPQLAALHWLCSTLVSRYNIERADVARHRDIAPGRKTDPMPPAFPWPAFADSLYLDEPPRAYRVRGLPIYQRQDLTGPLAGHLGSGETLLIDMVYSNGAGHDASGRGFVDLDGLEAL